MIRKVAVTSFISQSVTFKPVCVEFNFFAIVGMHKRCALQR